MTADDISNMLAAGALGVSPLSLVLAIWTSRKQDETSRRQRSEQARLEQIAREAANRAAVLSALQGEKESVAFTALHFSKSGLPADDAYREQVILALIQAAIFTSSDGTRAMVLGVLVDALQQRRAELLAAVALVESRFDRLARKVPALDLKHRRERLAMIKQALAEDEDRAS